METVTSIYQCLQNCTFSAACHSDGNNEVAVFVACVQRHGQVRINEIVQIDWHLANLVSRDALDIKQIIYVFVFLEE